MRDWPLAMHKLSKQEELQISHVNVKIKKHDTHHYAGPKGCTHCRINRLDEQGQPTMTETKVGK